MTKLDILMFGALNWRKNNQQMHRDCVSFLKFIYSFPVRLLFIFLQLTVIMHGVRHKIWCSCLINLVRTTKKRLRLLPD